MKTNPSSFFNQGQYGVFIRRFSVSGKRHRGWRLFCLLVMLCSVAPVQGKVVPAPIFSDNAILQRDKPISVWGTADAGEKVTVSFSGQSVTTVANASGKWRVQLAALPANSTPGNMVIQGVSTITLTNILVGEVWIAAGQSNMGVVLWKDESSAAETALPENQGIRFFQNVCGAAVDPSDKIAGSGGWTVANPKSRPGFISVGYFFAKKLNTELGVPVGIINASWGGTRIESWISAEGLDRDPLEKTYRLKERADYIDYAENKITLAAAHKAWTKAHGREDAAPAENMEFAGPNVSTEGWTSIQNLVTIRGPNIAERGVVWARREIEIVEKPTGKVTVAMTVNGFESVYWDGKLIRSSNFENYPGGNHYKGADIPLENCQPGKHVLALRFYMPYGQYSVGGLWFSAKCADSPWFLKNEVAYPKLANDVEGSAPKMLGRQPDMGRMFACIFNGTIAPLGPLAIRGIIWYQGEGNQGEPEKYRKLITALIPSWRAVFGQGDLPFYICQLPAYRTKTSKIEDSPWAVLRESQNAALALPNTGVAVTLDTGDADDIHPPCKRVPGERLALLALAKDYKKQISCTGPMYESMKVDGSKIILSFKDAGGGLIAAPIPETYSLSTAQKKTAPVIRNSPGSELEGFVICGEDKKWVWANAKIDGDKVVVWADSVPAPVAVRYAWSDNPTCNFCNKAGLPASPFRTDNFPLNVK
jgi:sialate O-acetylesterase